MSSTDATDGRCLLGGAVGGLNGVMEQDTLQLTAQAYDGNGNPVAANFVWYSSNGDLVSVSNTGLVTRVNQIGSGSQAVSYDSNGAPSKGQIGGISTIRAVALLPTGAEAMSGEIIVACQGSAPRQYGPGANGAASTPSISAGSFNLCNPALVGPNYSN